MIEQALQQVLLDHVAKLPTAMQHRVVDFAASLADIRAEPMPAMYLLEIAGSLPGEDAEEMRRAIEEGCQRIDADGW